MKIVHLVSGELNGGAARGAYWLHKALLKRGIDSKVIYSGLDRSGDEEISVRTNNWARMKLIASSRIASMPLRAYRRRHDTTFHLGLDGIAIEKIPDVAKADLVHLHWINQLVPLSSLKRLNKPIVWTLRDMWPFTGGCHYAMGCERYKTGCGTCPQLNSRHNIDLSSLGIWLKRRAYVTPIQFVGISTWITNCARESFVVKNRPVRTILNGIDLESFFPINRIEARKILGLDPLKPIVLIGAGAISDYYKGLDLFQEAWKHFRREDVSLCVFGHVRTTDIESIDRSAICFGFLNDPIAQRVVYSAANVFVAPSRYEAFGKTIVEALACGVPVVCFDSTGPKDIIQHQKCGYLARPFDSEDLRFGIRWVLDRTDTEFSEISEYGVKRVQEIFDSIKIAEQYHSLYQNILEM